MSELQKAIKALGTSHSQALVKYIKEVVAEELQAIDQKIADLVDERISLALKSRDHRRAYSLHDHAPNEAASVQRSHQTE